MDPCNSCRTIFGLSAVSVCSQRRLYRQRLRPKAIREKRLSPCRGPRPPLLPLSPKRTQVRLKSLLYLVWLTPDPLRTHGRPSGQECRLRLKRPPSSSRRLARHLPFISSTAFRALAPAAFFRRPLCFASLSAKKIWHTIFSVLKRTSKYSGRG